MPAGSLYINSDNLIEIDLLKLVLAGTYVNSGTVSWELQERDGTLITSGSLTYVTSSTGRWVGVIDKSDVLSVAKGGIIVEGTSYYLEVTIDNGSGVDDFRRIELVAKYHGTE